MAMAKQTIQPQNHFLCKPSFCTFKKYKIIITATAISNEETKNAIDLLEVKLLEDWRKFKKDPYWMAREWNKL